MENNNCEHIWIMTDKLPNIGKEWIVNPDGTKKEVYYHVYKCLKCNQEKTMSDDSVKNSNSNLEILNNMIIKLTESDVFWSETLKRFFDSLEEISETEKISFILKLQNNKELFNDFTKEIVKNNNSFEIFNKYYNK